MRIRAIMATALAIVLVWALFAFHMPLIRLFGFDWDNEIVGLWGDTFGALNTLFSALAFLMVLVNIKLQSDDLKQQKLEMDESRDEQLQLHFESTFFRLLSLLRELKGNIQFIHSSALLTALPNRPTARQKGDDAIDAMLIELAYWDALEPATDDLMAIYSSRIYAHAENGISPYFRVLQNILRSIDSADYLSEIDKVEYGNLLRSQITSNELALAGINALLPGSSRFRDYVIKYRLLKYLQAGHIRTTLETHLPAETFKSRTG